MTFDKTRTQKIVIKLIINHICKKHFYICKKRKLKWNKFTSGVDTVLDYTFLELQT